MKSYNITAADAGKRLDKWLLKALPALPMGLMQKYVRLKRIKINGKPGKADSRLSAGDVLELYISDEYFEQPKRVDSLLDSFRWRIGIVYEDEHLLIVDKPSGLITHPDNTEKLNTLVTHARAYLYQRGEYDSLNPESFAPVPLNRIDRFTSGIVMVAKTREALRVLSRAIREREVDKFYLAIVHGAPRPGRGMLDGFILKTPGRRKVQVLRKELPGAQRAKTRYRVLDSRDGLSLVECELLTGRTHQIRAQFADIGHPLLGDLQYGHAEDANLLGFSQQALCAYKLTFRFSGDAGALAPLNGRSFEVPNVPFLRDYFPDI